MKIARRLIVSGLVQGVGFRYFTQRSAARHQVLGYVKNLKDGRVECYVEAEEKNAQEFLNDITAGPTYSRVEDIEETVLEPEGLLTAFRIER
jgi:acylphosphatase